LFFGLGLMGLGGVAGCGHSGAPVQTQPGKAMAPEMGHEGRPAEGVPRSGVKAGAREIHVNQDCVILQDQIYGVPGVSVPGGTAVAGGETNPAWCHLESQLTSNHVKGTVVNGAVERSVVVVKEQQYLLQDLFEQPVVFVVEHAVPDGWKIDSDPAPTAVANKVALFRVMVQPGQVVKLHVGEEHEIPLAE
jgi:hypothetical protein